jgi:hypothetical protein
MFRGIADVAQSPVYDFSNLSEIWLIQMRLLAGYMVHDNNRLAAIAELFWENSCMDGDPSKRKVVDLTFARRGVSRVLVERRLKQRWYLAPLWHTGTRMAPRVS